MGVDYERKQREGKGEETEEKHATRRRHRPSPSVAEAEVLWLRKRDLAEGRRALLSYWTAFAAFSVYDVYAEFLFSWLPLYYLAKTTMLLWIVVPEARGAVVFFEHFLSPWFTALRRWIESSAKPAFRRVVSKLVMIITMFWTRQLPPAVTSAELRRIRTTLEETLAKADSERRRRGYSPVNGGSESEEWSEISAPSSMRSSRENTPPIITAAAVDLGD